MIKPYEKFILETGACFDVFDQMTDEVLFFDINARLIYLNPSAEKSEGYTLEEAYGKSLFEIYDFVNDVRKENSPAYLALTTRKPVRNMVCIYYTMGQRKTKTISSNPIFKDGELVGTFNIQRDFSQLSDMIDKNLELQSRLNKNRYWQGNDKYTAARSELIGESEFFRYTLSLVQMAAGTDSNVLLTGEDGCGKNTFARFIHENSDRKEASFISVDCAAIPEDLFENLLFGTVNQHYISPGTEGILFRLGSGTLFLENVTYLPAGIQMKLVRIMEEYKEFRLICSSNLSPTEIIRKNLLQMDFFYCISVVQIRIPSLRERREDIPLLTKHFMEEFNCRFHKNITKVSQEVASWFNIYQWPGNVRQFRSCIEAAMNYAKDTEKIMADDLPANIFYDNGRKDLDKPDEYFSKRQLYLNAQEKEREDIVKALKAEKGNISKAARRLGISRQLMYYRMKKYHID